MDHHGVEVSFLPLLERSPFDATVPFRPSTRSSTRSRASLVRDFERAEICFFREFPGYSSKIFPISRDCTSSEESRADEIVRQGLRGFLKRPPFSPPSPQLPFQDLEATTSLQTAIPLSPLPLLLSFFLSLLHLQLSRHGPVLSEEEDGCCCQRDGGISAREGEGRQATSQLSFTFLLPSPSLSLDFSDKQSASDLGDTNLSKDEPSSRW